MQKYLLGLLIIIQLILSISVKHAIDSSYDLPKNVIPIRYILTMEPHFETNSTSSWFNGSIVIELKVLESTNNITLHARDLNVTETSIKVTKTDGVQINHVNTTRDEVREFYTIHLEEDLTKDEYYNLTIEFYGDLKFDNVGFYLAKYETDDGQERLLAITDFEASDARKAFPCFDEPAIKANFLIKLIRPENYTSVSNEELLSTENLGDGKYLDTYKETVDMSTYLVAFMVSDFEHTVQEERHRVFARQAAIREGKLDYAVSIGVEILQALEEYTGINYTLSKMDSIAIPDRYFTDEAMENWGMVTFSEKHLFISNETSTTEDLQRCTCYISHEFAHQWFGNLVTFTGWKYIWLTEGFGSYFQYYIASVIRPSWRLMDQFVLEIVQSVIEYDTSFDTQPLNYQPQSIGTIPSPWICYYKASTIIRMMEHFLTNPIFHKGLKIYLNRHKFGAVEPKDLYQAFQEVVDEAGANERLLKNNSVASILGTWDSNTGHPLITVTRDYELGSITFSQERDLYEGKVEENAIWYVPISYVIESDENWNFSDTTADLWLTEKSITLNENFSSNAWILINKQQTGFYRVNYDLINWDKIATFLNNNDYNAIHVLNRAQLIDDAFSFAQVGRLPFHIPLNLTKYLVKETDYIVLKTFHKSIIHLDKIMSASSLYGIFQDYVANIFSTAYDHLGFNEKDTDDHLDKFTRKVILNWLCKYGHFECRRNAIEKVKEWQTNGSFNVSTNLQSSVLCAAMRTASTKEWEFLYGKLSEYKGKEINDILIALGCSEDKSIIKNYLDRLNNTSTFSNYKRRVAIVSIVNSGSAGLVAAFDYLKEHKNNLPKEILMFLGYDVGDRLTTENQITELKELNSKEFLYGIKVAQENLNWIKKGYLKEIEEWLLENNLNSIQVSNVI